MIVCCFGDTLVITLDCGFCGNVFGRIATGDTDFCVGSTFFFARCRIFFGANGFGSSMVIENVSDLVLSIDVVDDFEPSFFNCDAFIFLFQSSTP